MPQWLALGGSGRLVPPTIFPLALSPSQHILTAPALGASPKQPQVCRIRQSQGSGWAGAGAGFACLLNQMGPDCHHGAMRGIVVSCQVVQICAAADGLKSGLCALGIASYNQLSPRYIPEELYTEGNRHTMKSLQSQTLAWEHHAAALSWYPGACPLATRKQAFPAWHCVLHGSRIPSTCSCVQHTLKHTEIDRHSRIVVRGPEWGTTLKSSLCAL